LQEEEAMNKTNSQKALRRERIRTDIARAWYNFSRSKLSVVGLVVVSIIVFFAIFAPFVSPYPEHSGAYVDFKNASNPPSLNNWCGTDVFGRDVLSRVIFAFRGALTMGIVVLIISVPLGTAVGLLGGYFSGTWIETIVMRITDVFLSIPPLILALAIAAMLRPTLMNAMIAICVSWWPWYARLVYGMAASLRNEPFIKAAELSGASTLRIMFFEMLPNFKGPVFTKMTLDMGWVILTGASLSFVGLGEQPPIPALGTMVSDGAKYLPTYWWISIFPAIAIMVIILSFNLLGDGIREMLSGGER
jgi:peptide/nickel transport system permease protein